MGREVIQGILLGLAAVVAVVLVGVYITLGGTGIIVGAGVATLIFAVMWYMFNRGEKQPE